MPLDELRNSLLYHVTLLSFRRTNVPRDHLPTDLRTSDRSQKGTMISEGALSNMYYGYFLKARCVGPMESEIK